MKRTDITDPQPAPVARAGAPSLHDVAAALHADRRDHGLSKYQSLLQTFNGRSAGVDKLQESLDRLVYEIQGVIEAEALRRALNEFHADLDRMADSHGDAFTALERYEELLNPAALAVRADAIAAELTGDRR